jgi:hemoglobin-like flavoprotein
VTAALFYDYLFLLDPTLRHLFRKEMSEHGRMLMAVLSSAVRGLNQTEKRIPVLKDLGRRHAGYGLSNLHYETVGAALMLTLETGLGGDFTPDVREARDAAYALIAEVIQEGASEADMPLAA